MPNIQPNFTEFTPPGENNEKDSKNENKDLLYATEELLDALPRAWTRSILYVLTGFALLVIPWATLSKVDETGNARGRVEPKGATYKLDSPRYGSVIAVKVKEGDAVKIGQVLLELESKEVRNEIQQVQSKIEGLRIQRSQLELLKNQLVLASNVQEQQNLAQEAEKMAQIHQARQQLDGKQTTYNLQKQEKLATVDKAKESIDSGQTDLNLANNRLSRDLREVERYRELWQKGAVPQIKVVELSKEAESSEQAKVQAHSAIQQAKLRLKEEQSRYQTIVSQADSDIKQAQLYLSEQQNSLKTLQNAGQLALIKIQQQLKDLQSQVAATESQIQQANSEIQGLNYQLQQRIVRSPVDGVIFELPVKKPGAVLQAGQPIASVAPKSTAFVLKAQMPIQQSGFVKVGKPAKIKFDAYPFQDYGILQGRVSWISPDSKVTQTPQGTLETFELEIALDKSYLQNGNQRIQIAPGQTANAEVIIRQRRVIDFLIDPFKKLQQGGLQV